MRYDDTLETVLAGDVSTSFGKASAWRQLVDLIGRRRVAADARAFNLLRRIRDEVPIGVRAASARALEHVNPPAPLVALCALDDISVAAPLLRTARMSSGEWVELLPRLSSAGRSVLRARRDLPPGIERALEAFGPIDFVVSGAAAEVVAESTPEAAADVPAVIASETVDEPVPLTEVEPALVALPVIAEDEDAEPVALGESGSVLEAVARVESRIRMRLRPVLDPVETPVVEVAPEPDPAPATEPEPEVEPTAVPANISSFVSVGTAALGIPVVAQALEAVEGENRPVPAQSGTDGEPSVAIPLATESPPAHASDMEEVFILGNRDPEPVVADTADVAPEGPFEIADVVARIDAFYTLQQERAAHAPPPVRIDGFRFETDELGVIRWVEGVSRAPLIGLSLELNNASDGSRADGVAAGALRQRAVFNDARLTVIGESDAAGEWRISGAPAFDRATGRFSGYRGTARRPRREESATPAAAPLADPAADSLRQLMHELRTPTNAIAGFAEMIEREMLGDAPPVYRERAGTIRDHARALLAAIDDLDIAARIEASALTLHSGEVTLRPILARIADDLAALAELRGAWIALPIDDPVVRGDARAIERMLSRLLATLLSAARDGERVGVQVSEAAGVVAIAFDRPDALAGHSGEALFAMDDEQEDAALLGTGFALWLVRNIARELGGQLAITPEAITVELPAMVTKSLEQAR
ncbi:MULTISPECIES: sensor histidine kinase [unclassified Sphingomonas]|uniref:sensor histidine kinase n=1 Tax=unclassified Sphingomonas TaxID=196159 RepID=UPI002151B31C|nr:MULTISPECIES: histidine kinase dimerization/phospho-acceptor domain-containing protein [unclassified Sphingomonas]MCR5872137.1 sensor histidine kinase [Sphingomonas sp. J344]UUX99552.1 sensor histidine kinase [Sphingomonas sp. J315]